MGEGGRGGQSPPPDGDGAKVEREGKKSKDVLTPVKMLLTVAFGS